MNYEQLNNWQRENVLQCAVYLRKGKDDDIIEEMLRRKEKYGTSRTFSLRRWVRLGFEQDKDI